MQREDAIEVGYYLKTIAKEGYINNTYEEIMGIIDNIYDLEISYSEVKGLITDCKLTCASTRGARAKVAEGLEDKVADLERRVKALEEKNGKYFMPPPPPLPKGNGVDHESSSDID